MLRARQASDNSTGLGPYRRRKRMSEAHGKIQSISCQKLAVDSELSGHSLHSKKTVAPR